MSALKPKLSPLDSSASAATQFDADDLPVDCETPQVSSGSPAGELFWPKFYNPYLRETDTDTLLLELAQQSADACAKGMLFGGPTGPGPVAVLQIAETAVLKDCKAGLLLLQILKQTKLSPRAFQSSGLMPALEVLSNHCDNGVAKQARALLYKQRRHDYKYVTFTLHSCCSLHVLACCSVNAHAAAQCALDGCMYLESCFSHPNPGQCESTQCP